MTSTRRPKSRRNRWLTPVFALVLAGFAAAGWYVAQEAQDAVLESRSGSITSVNIDPDAPGFRAFTEPTPTALVLHTTVTSEGEARLVGSSVLIAADGGLGGTVLSVPGGLVAPGSSATVAELFAGEGFGAVVAAMKDTLGVGFGDVVVLDAGSWITLMAPDLPLTMTLRSDLVEEVGDSGLATVLDGGTRQFSPAEVGLVARHENPDEASIGVARRQQEIWRAWISRTAVAPERPDLFGVEEGFIELISDLASGEVAYRMIPVSDSTGTGSATTYSIDAPVVDELIASLITFPIAPEPGGRATVMVLDGTGGTADQRSTLADIVAAGGQVAILGNAASSSVAVTEIQVHDPELAEVAREIADRLGADPPVAVPLGEATVAITVIVGADQVPAA